MGTSHVECIGRMHAETDSERGESALLGRAYATDWNAQTAAQITR